MLLTVLFLTSCGGGDHYNIETSTSKYTVLSEDVLFIPGKSQISTYVLYNDTVYNKNVLKNIALKILAESEKKILEDNEHAKIFMIYLYLNEQDYLNDKSKCLATLYKGINDPMPEIAYTMPQKEIVYDSPEAIDTRTKSFQPAKSAFQDPYDVIEGAFENSPKKSKVQPMLEEIMRVHGVEVTDRNINKVASALVAMRMASLVGVTEMDILKHVYQKGSPDQSIQVDIANSATLLEKTK